MAAAVEGGHVEIVKLCKEWGATNFNDAFESAEERGDHVEIVKLCREWESFWDIHRELFQHHHKRKFLGNTHREFFQYHHKRKFFRQIHYEVLPIAWHPERFWDWCVDKEEKGFLEERLWL